VRITDFAERFFHVQPFFLRKMWVSFSFAAFQFSFSACKFNVQKSKEGTGRVVMWKMGIRNSFTMEATFCGSTLGKAMCSH
jgi:hypothetical protein